MKRLIIGFLLFVAVILPLRMDIVRAQGVDTTTTVDTEPIPPADDTTPSGDKTRDQLLLESTPQPPAPVKLKPIYKGMTTTASTKLGQGESFFIKAGTLVGFKLQDLIKPWYGGQEKKISTPDFLPDTVLHQKFNSLLLSQQTQDSIIHYSEDNKNVLSNRFCAVQTNKSDTGGHLREDIESTGNQVSSNVEHSQSLFEGARLANSAIGLQFVTPNTNGNLDMNLAEEIMGGSTILGFCDWNFLSQDKPPTENKVVRLSTFGAGGNGVIFQVLQSVILAVEKICDSLGVCHTDTTYDKDTAALETRLTEVGHDSNFHQLANIGNATDNKVMDKAPYDWTKMLTVTRGWAFNFLPEKQVDVVQEERGGTTYQYSVLGREPDGGDAFAGKLGDLKHGWPIVGNATQREKESACMVTADSLQASTAYGTKEDPILIGDACPPPPSPTPGTGNWNCREMTSSSPLIPAGQSFADSGIFSCPDHKENAWSKCAPDVIDRSTTACIDPAFALTVWLHETGASNYKCSEAVSSGVPVEDFGQHVNTPPENFSAQLDQFLKTAKARSADCSPATINDFWATFWLGQFKPTGGFKCFKELTADDQKKVTDDVAYLNQIYHMLTGKDLPASPVTCNK